MDTRAYIESGVIEAVVLGHASEQEVREVNCLASIYPEVQQELDALSEALENYAESHKQKVPENWENDILGALEGVNQEEPLSVVSSSNNSAGTQEREVPLANSETNGGQRSLSPFMGWAAAIAILLIGGWMFLDQNKQIEQLGMAMQELEKSNMVVKENLRLANTERELLLNPKVERILLSGTESFPEAYAQVFWDKGNDQVYLQAKGAPEITEEESFQLWVIRDGAPVSMGVIDNENRELLIALESTSSGSAFAITIEPRGGSLNPTLERMVVIGNVTS